MKRTAAALLLCCAALSTPAQAQIHFSRVNVCNEGNTRLAVAALTVIEHLFSAQALMESWIFIEPGKCLNVVQESQSITANIGFAYRDADGRYHPYTPVFGFPKGRTRYGAKTLCVPQMAVTERGAVGTVMRKYADRQECPASSMQTKVTAIIRADPPATQTLELSPDIGGGAAAPEPAAPSDSNAGAELLSGFFSVMAKNAEAKTALARSCAGSYAAFAAKHNLGHMTPEYINRWCGCIAPGLHGVLTGSEREAFRADAVRFVGDVESALAQGTPDWRLYTPISSCKR